MTKTDYLAKRESLKNEAQSLIDSGNVEKANEKMEEIKALDKKFEDEAVAQANLSALGGVSFAGLKNYGEGAKTEGLKTNADSASDDDIYNSLEYRKAFQNYFVKGEAIPARFRNLDQTTTSTDTVLVPTYVSDKIYEKMEKIGQIYSRVTKVNIPGNLRIAVANLIPEAKWVEEGEGSDRQKYSDDYVDFTGHTVEVKLSFSLFVSATTLEKFESQFVDMISRALVKGIEQKIVAGTGVGTPTGIVPTETTKIVNVARTGSIGLDTIKKTEKLITAAMDSSNPVYLMSKSSFEEYMDIKDDANRPIASIPIGENGQTLPMIRGREVVYSDGYISDYADSVQEDTTFGVTVSLADYILNEIVKLTIFRYRDNDKNQDVIKGIALVDGKLARTDSLVKIVKKSS